MASRILQRVPYSTRSTATLAVCTSSYASASTSSSAVMSSSTFSSLFNVFRQSQTPMMVAATTTTVGVRSFAAAAAAGSSSTPSSSAAFLTLDETTQGFDDVVQKNPKVLAYFTASWCGPCRMIAPHFAAIADTHKENVKFVKIDIDENPDAASSANIRSVPTFRAFHSGKVTNEIAGANIDGLKSLVNDLVARA